MTECLVTVCGHSDPSRRNRFFLNGCTYDVDAVISTSSLPRQILQRISVSGHECSFVVLVGASERATANAIVNGFCEEQLKDRPEESTRITLVVGEGGSDAVLFECERVSDIESLTLENDSAQVLSVAVTRTVPTIECFEFHESRLTIIFSPPDLCDELPKLVDTTAHQLRIVPKLVVCHIHSPDEKTLGACLQFRSQSRMESFGAVDPPSTLSRLREVRHWTYKVSERARLTPASPGPYLIHLNPTTTSDKLAHPISPGYSFIVGSGADAGNFDLALSPTGQLESVWSPHCRFRFEQPHVFIRPECGLTYVNGVLLADEVELGNNDRIIIGTEIALRFALIGRERDPSLRHIVDWSQRAVEEFCEIGHETCGVDTSAIELENLKSQVRSRSAGACLVLTNPSENYRDTVVWSLDQFEDLESITIGANQIIAAPTKTKATLVRDDGGYNVTIGTTTKRVHHGSRFLLGELLFLINDTSCRRTGLDKHLAVASEAPPPPFLLSPTALTDLRNELFDLQWTVSSLFDFAFPTESTSSPDPHSTRRRLLASDAVLTADCFPTTSLSSSIKSLTDALRMIGSQLSLELNSPSGDVNAGLLRALHERNRTIEQLLLGTDSEAPIAWRQLSSLHQALGEKLTRITKLEGDVSERSSGFPQREELNLATPCSVAPNALQILKSKVIIPTPSVARRVASTVDVIARTGNVRHLWDRYCRDLDALIESNGGVHKIHPSKQQSVLLALLDVILAFETGSKHGWIVQGDRNFVDRHIASWQIAVEQCCSAFSKPAITDSRRPLPSPLSKSRLSSTSSSRNASPAPMSRSSSRDRVQAQSKNEPIISRPRAPSPLHRTTPTLNTSPAAIRSRPTQGASSGLPLTARSTASKVSTVRGVSPMGNGSLRTAITNRAASPKSAPLQSAPSGGRQPIHAPVRATSPTVMARSQRATSPKTLLTRQLMELEVGNYKRRT